MEQQTLSTIQVANIAGVTLRQLQHWDEIKVITPHHVGHRRVYTQEEALGAAVIAELRRRKVPLQRIRRVVRELTRLISKHVDTATLAGPQLWLIVDQRTKGRECVSIFSDCVSTLNWLGDQTAPQHILDLTDIMARLQPTRREVGARPITRY